MGLVQYLYLVFRAITVHKFEAQQKQYKAWFLEFPAGTSGDHPGIYSQTQTAGCGEAGTFGAGKFSSSMGVNQSQVKLGFMLDIHSWMGWKEHF